MRWKIAGEYIMGCTCSSSVHWPIDGSMNDENGRCSSVSVFRIDEGYFDDVSLSETKFALFNFFPEKLSREGWTMGMVADMQSSDEQTAAISTMVRGVEGGPLAAVSSLIGFMGMDQASVGYLTEGQPLAIIEGRARFVFTPTLEDGQPVRAPNAMFVFAENYEIGRSEGRAAAFGSHFALDYGEFGRFSFNEFNTGMEREFRPSRLGGLGRNFDYSS